METTTSKLSELIDLGFDLIKRGGIFGLVSPGHARRVAVMSFVGGALLGAGIAGTLFMSGYIDIADLRERLKGKVSEVAGKVSGEASEARPS